MASDASLLEIDEKRAVESIKVYLHNLQSQHSTSGFSLGLSGGIDSAVLAALAVQSLGKASVHATYLFDRDSVEELAINAQLVANWLGIKLEVKNIEPAMRKSGVYEPIAMRVTNYSWLTNRILHWLYHSIVGETPYMSSLRVGSGEFGDQDFRISIFKTTCKHLEAAFNARHVYRHQLLESEAKAKNFLLLGAANRTEWLVGWFVKGGIDDLPLQPLKGLYKTQVRQLATFLGVPDEIQTQPPSPDMMKGITDEFALGMSYEKIDIALDYLEGGLSEQAISEMRVTKEELNQVREMNRLSSWKRETTNVRPPVDGGPTGGLRRYTMRSRMTSYFRINAYI